MQRQVTNQVELSRFKDEYLIYGKEEIYIDDIDPYNLMNIKPYNKYAFENIVN